MRKTLLFIIVFCVGTGFAGAAVRGGTTTSSTPSHSARATATVPRNTTTINARGVTTTPRQTSGITVRKARVATQQNTNNVVLRPNQSTDVSTVSVRNAQTPRTGITNTSARQMAAPVVASNTFDIQYTECRDAYFTCMDQFCAQQNDTYRRCVCSSRLTDIQARERALSQTTTQLQDFKDLNIDAISKTQTEVNAMLTASSGEIAANTAKDKSESTYALSEISSVLSSTKNKALSTQGKLDIGGDIKEIWATTDLAGGANIANLTGDALYNAVHSQCAQMVSEMCKSESTLGMVVSAYGMYIENDCTTLANALDKQKIVADTAIRNTEREMNVARLENYDMHNSSSINDCIANVRNDITADTACGKNFVHCLDTTGLYLNRDTGEPIYTADFYRLESQISLNGDILNNRANRMIVSHLNNMRIFAKKSLDSCIDLSDNVWDEFMRQSIREIYQSQQERVRQVKDDCLNVVNKCYDEQSASLKDFNDSDKQALIGQRLELSEELCATQMDTCANLYGDVELLVAAMHNITDQKIAQNCRNALRDYVEKLCAVPSNDSLHVGPYGCRTYAPGSQKYATMYDGLCNYSNSEIDENVTVVNDNNLPTVVVGNITYTNMLATMAHTAKNKRIVQQKQPNTPERSRIGQIQLSATNFLNFNQNNNSNSTTSGFSNICGDYTNSLYKKLARYATQVCTRPSATEAPGYILPTTILEDINVVMDETKINMTNELSKECDRLGGTWISGEWNESDTTNPLWTLFYNETSASTKWGYCADVSN